MLSKKSFEHYAVLFLTPLLLVILIGVAFLPKEQKKNIDKILGEDSGFHQLYMADQHVVVPTNLNKIHLFRMEKGKSGGNKNFPLKLKTEIEKAKSEYPGWTTITGGYDSGSYALVVNQPGKSPVLKVFAF